MGRAVELILLLCVLRNAFVGKEVATRRLDAAEPAVDEKAWAKCGDAATAANAVIVDRDSFIRDNVYF